MALKSLGMGTAEFRKAPAAWPVDANAWVLQAPGTQTPWGLSTPIRFDRRGSPRNRGADRQGDVHWWATQIRSPLHCVSYCQPKGTPGAARTGWTTGD